MYLRVALGVGCEESPTTVKIPATSNRARTIPTRRFMKCSFSGRTNATSKLAEKCSVLAARPQEGMSQVPGENTMPGAFLKRNPADAGEIERSPADQYPEQDTLRQRPPADFLDSGTRNSRADQKERNGQTQAA